MSITAADVFDHSRYDAPKAELVENSEATPDNIFSIEGRIGVLRYNTRVLQGFLMMVIGIGVPVFFHYSGFATVAIMTTVLGSMAVLSALAIMILSAIKRLHDLDYSGWFSLLAAIPIIGIIWSLYYALKPGSDEVNRFGAMRPANKADKIMGVLGIVLMVALSLASLANIFR